MQWNIKRFYARLRHIHQAIDALAPDVMCFQETWLKPYNSVKINGFQDVNRSDRIDRQGGGVMILVRHGIPFSTINLKSNLESCAVQLHLPSRSISLCSLYLPTDLSNNIIMNEISNLISQLPKPFLLCLDSNAHHISWGSDYADKRGYIIDEWLTEHDLALLNSSQPTYIHSNGTLSHIDSSICSQELSHDAEWATHHDTLHSNHFPIIINLGIECPLFDLPPRWKLDEADWVKYKAEIKLQTNFTDPDTAYANLKNCILTAAASAIPCSPPTFNCKYSKMWWNKDCSIAHKNKSRALHLYKKHKGNMQYWISFKRA